MAQLALGLVLTLFALNIDAQFLKSCVSEESISTKTCCPVPSGYSEACGADAGLGSCVYVEPSDEGEVNNYDDIMVYDERYHWPSKFFDYGCECTWPFSGQDCGKCVFGYHGDQCDRHVPIIRRSITAMEIEDVHTYYTYLNWAKGNNSDHVAARKTFRYMFDENGNYQSAHTELPIYDFYVWMHYYGNMRAVYEDPASGDLTSASMMMNHHSSNFLPWHRILLLHIERDIQILTGDEAFAIPYWDWSGLRECNVCTDQYYGANDERGAVGTSVFFKSWYQICGNSSYYDTSAGRICDPDDRIPLQRMPGMGDEKFLPPKKDVGFTLSVPNYDTTPYDQYSNCSFRNTLGGNGNTTTGDSVFVRDGKRFMHGQVHRFIGGVMNDIPSSISDPIFQGHHGYLDRLFEKWMRRWKADVNFYPVSGTNFGHNRDAVMIPWFPPMKNADAFQNSVALGYDYDDMDETGQSSNDAEFELDPVAYGSCIDRESVLYY